MYRNLIIMSVSFFILFMFTYVYLKREKVHKSTKIFSIILFVIWMVMIAIPNTLILESPLTPAVSGKLIDADTGQPISGCNVKGYWQIESITIVGMHWDAYERFDTNTNNRGEFQLPRYFKALSLFGAFPVLMQHYGGIRVAVYSHGYKYTITTVSRSEKKSVTLTISLKRLDDPKAYLENLLNLNFDVLSHYQNKITNDEKKYLVDEYRAFDTNFLNVNYEMLRAGQYLGRVAALFEGLGEIEEAMSVLRKEIAQYPDKSLYFKSEIRRLQWLQERRQKKEKQQ